MRLKRGCSAGPVKNGSPLRYHGGRDRCRVAPFALGVLMDLWHPIKLGKVRANLLIGYLWLLTIAAAFFGSTLSHPDLPGFFAFRVLFLVHLVWLAILFLAGGLSWRKRFFPAGVKLYMVFLAFWLAWGWLSLLWAVSKFDALRHIFYLCTGLGVVFFCIYHTRDCRYLKGLFYAVFAAMSVVVLVGLWETVTGNHLPVSMLYGKDSTWIAHIPSSFFHNPNDLGTLLALYIPVIYGVMRITGNLIFKLGAGACALLGIYLLLASQSRANMLALCCAALGMLVLFSGHFRKHLNGYRWIVFPVVLCILLLFLLVLGGYLQDNKLLEIKPLLGLKNHGALQLNALEPRLKLLVSAVAVFREHPLTGVGAGNAEHYMLQYTRYTHGLTNIHNWWVEVFVNYGAVIGVPYLIFFAGLLMALYRTAVNSADTYARHLSAALFLSMCAFPLSVTSSSTLAGMTFMWTLFALALAVLHYDALADQSAAACRHPVRGKNVLMVSHIFPPTGGVGVLRLVKFCKFLPRRGWGVNVLTTRRKEQHSVDTQLLGEIPGEVLVARTWHVDFASVFLRFKSVYLTLRRFFLSGAGFRDAGSRVPAGGESPRSGCRKLVDLILVPDEGVGWGLPALMHGVKLVEQRDIHVLYSTAPHYSTHVTGLLLKKITGRPWVADFRDPWVGNTFARFPTGLHRWLHSRLEYMVIKNADAVLTISSGLNEMLRERYPSVPAGKFHTLHNGYDPDDFDVPPAELPGSKFIFVHAGSFYGEKNPGTFLQALSQACRSLPGLAGQVLVYFVGHGAGPYLELAGQLGLGDTVRAAGYVPHREAVGYIKAAHVALLIPGGDKTAATGKVFQYLAAQKPILTIAHSDNGVFAILDELNPEYREYSAPPDDVARLRDLILRLFRRYEEGTLQAPAGDYACYSREGQAARLSEIMESLLRSEGRNV